MARKLIRVGAPLPLQTLKSLLDPFEDPDAIVKLYNGEIIVEVPESEAGGE